jgi:hypothetical protein
MSRARSNGAWSRNGKEEEEMDKKAGGEQEVGMNPASEIFMPGCLKISKI